jgi:hypothetical protein
MTTISLRRYTTLPFLLDILNKKCLTLLDPKNWEDKNDSYYIELYKENLGLKSVLVLCFAESVERYHHWKIYSGSLNGVCIEFRKDKLLECLNVSGIRTDYVQYKTYDEVRKEPLAIYQFPFMKRYAFEDEREFRIIYEDRIHEFASKDFKISVNSINRIIFNPWMPESVYSSIKQIVKNIKGCKKIKVMRTTLVDNKKWKRMGEEVFRLSVKPRNLQK